MNGGGEGGMYFYSIAGNISAFFSYNNHRTSGPPGFYCISFNIIFVDRTHTGLLGDKEHSVLEHVGLTSLLFNEYYLIFD